MAPLPREGAPVRLLVDVDQLSAGTVTGDLGEFAGVLVAEERPEGAVPRNQIRTMERRPRGGREAV